MLALRFLSMIEAMVPLTVLPVGPVELDAGYSILRRFADQNLTLTDAVGLHLMASQPIANCWSTDRHLGISGIPVIINII